MDTLTLKSYGKINLALEVTNKRSDGYHNLFSVMQTIELHDKITFIESSEILVESDNESINKLGNIITKTINLLKDYSKTKKGISVYLEKKIPVSSGLGGGSSNAAVVLNVLNKLWDLKITPSTLQELSASIGSDVPFFMKGGTALIQDRGNNVLQLHKIRKLWILLVPEKNLMSNKTQNVYNNLKASNFSDGSNTLKLKNTIEANQKISNSSMLNSLKEAAMDLFPNLEKTEATMIQSGAKAVHLSGSGPTLFATFQTKKSAEKVQHFLTMNNINSLLTSTVNDNRWNK